MRPLETALHSASLLACAALGVGLWTLKREPAPIPAAAAAAPTADDGKIRALEGEIESLRRRQADLERPQGGAVRTRAPGGAADAAALLAALDDPRVREKLRAISGAALPGSSLPRKPSSQDSDLFGGMDLNEQQKGVLLGSLSESGRQIADLFGMIDRKAMTPEQALAELARLRTQEDDLARSVLNEAQLKAYLEKLSRFREGAADMLKKGWAPGVRMDTAKEKSVSRNPDGSITLGMGPPGETK